MVGWVLGKLMSEGNKKSKRQHGKTKTSHFYELKELKKIGTKHLQNILVSNLENAKHVFFFRILGYFDLGPGWTPAATPCWRCVLVLRIGSWPIQTHHDVV